MPRKPISELRKKMKPASAERAERRAQEEILEMDLQQLRREKTGLTQVELAKVLEVTQGAISHLEGRTDMLLGNLAGYVKALGGRLELRAIFPDQEEIRITQFEGVKEQLIRR